MAVIALFLSTFNCQIIDISLENFSLHTVDISIKDKPITYSLIHD